MRAVVVLAIVAAVLAAFIVFVDRRHPSGDAEHVTHVRLLPAFNRAAVRRITITRAGSAPFTLVRQPPANVPAWHVAPGANRGNDAAVDDLLAALDFADSDRTAEIDPAAAGLAPPAARVEIESAGPRLLLALGRVEPSGQGVYAQVNDAGPIRVAPKRLLDLADRGSDDFRDRRLFPVIAPSVDEIAWSAPGGSAGKLTHRAGRWLGSTGPVMNERMDEILRQLLALQVETFVPPIAATADLPFISLGGNARVMVRIVDETRVDRDGPDGHDGATVGGAALAAIWPALARAAARDTRLVAEAPNAVATVELRDGARRLAMRREHGAWIFTEPHVPYAADPQLVDAWLAQLHAAEVSEAGRGAGRQLVIGGRFQEATDVVPKDPAYALLDPDPLHFRDRRVLSFAHFDVRHLRRSGQGSATVDLATPDGEQWRVVAPPGAEVDRANVARVVSALDDLHATAFRTKAPSGASVLRFDVEVQPPGEPRPTAYALVLHDAPNGACVGRLDADTTFDIAPAACTELRLPVLAGGH
jgi:hypothetical protein